MEEKMTEKEIDLENIKYVLHQLILMLGKSGNITIGQNNAGELLKYLHGGLEVRDE